METTPEIIRLKLVGEIVDSIAQLRSVLTDEQRPFTESFLPGQDGLILTGDALHEVLDIDYIGEFMKFTWNGVIGYAGMMGLVTSRSEGMVANAIYLSEEGEAIFPPGILPKRDKFFLDDSEGVFLGEIKDQFFVRLDDWIYYIPKREIYTTDHELFSIHSVQRLFIDLMEEGVFVL
jgi:hypothetical protein